MNNDIIKKEELLVEVSESAFAAGTYVTYHEELHRISEEKANGRFVLERIHPETGEVMETSEHTLGNLKEYYKPVNVSIEKIKTLAMRILEGEEMEEIQESGGTELMAMGGKNTLVSLREEASRAALVAQKVKRYAEIIISQRTAELQAKLKGVKAVINKMNKQIENLDYAIQIVETYAGIKEYVQQLSSGVSAGEDTPVVFRQAVIFIDEELALVEDDFDYRKMDKFDDWLLADGNFKKLLPDEKCMVACKPRRTKMEYCDKEWLNAILNQPNFETLFLIRNGENLYRLESEHIVLGDRMFPNKDEFEKELEKERKEPFCRQGNMERFQKKYTRVAFLMQGLLERSDVFCPHSFTGSFIKSEGLDSNSVQLLYELDFSHAVSDGRPSPSEWMSGLNDKLCEGKRIFVYGYSFDPPHDFIRYYRSQWTAPCLPGNGVYTLYNNPECKEYAYGSYKHLIKYLPADYYTARKNKESIQIDVRRTSILNYDDASLEDIEYYLNSRLHRSQYYTFVKLMKAFKKQYLADKKSEDEYVQMMIGQIMAKGYKPKEGITLEEVVHKAIETVKGRLKWKRPITAKEKETYTLVSRTLFSKKFVEKYLSLN